MSVLDDGVYLAHIRESIDLIREFTTGGREEFAASRLIQYATVRALQTMAESTQRLSDGLKAAHPEVPWRRIAAFRNVLVHAYMNINLDIVWEVVAVSVPALEVVVRDELERRGDSA